MVDVNVRSRLLMGLDINIHNIIIKNYKLGEIFRDIGLLKYLQMTSIVNKKVRDFIKDEYLDEIKGVQVFDVFCMSKDMQEVLCTVMNFFTGYNWKFVSTDDFYELMSINQNGERVHINRYNYVDIVEVIKIMYCLTDSKRESDRDDIDEEMRGLLLEFEEEENKIRKAKGAVITMTSMIDGVANKHPSLNLINIWEYTVYQLYHAYQRINRIDNENRILTAIYTGNMSGNKTDLEKIHWANDSD